MSEIGRKKKEGGAAVSIYYYYMYVLEHKKEGIVCDAPNEGGAEENAGEFMRAIQR